MKKLLIIFSLNLLVFCVRASYTPESIPDVRLQDKYNHVSNPDGIIDTSDVQEINSLLNNLEDSLTIEVQVVAVQSIGEEDTRMFANKLFNLWEIGLKGKDNGLLILLVIDQREIVFETGYGMEEILPDALCYRMQQEYMVPYLKDNEFSAGMREGVREVTRYLLEGDYSFDSQENKQGESGFWAKFGAWGIVSLFIGVFILINLIFARNFIRSLKKEYTKKSNAAENLFYAHNNISLPVGCLISLFLPLTGILVIFFHLYYRNKIKRLASVCPQCEKTVFHQQIGQEHDQYLTDKEKFEIKIKSVEHYVFCCDSCSYVFKFNSEEKHSDFKRCPVCNTKAFKRGEEKIIKPPSFKTKGESEFTYTCLFCNHSENIIEPVAKLIRSTDSSSGSSYRSSSSRSSFGSSSSRGSSSGSSHGGGHSGGGGSRSRF